MDLFYLFFYTLHGLEIGKLQHSDRVVSTVPGLNLSLRMCLLTRNEQLISLNVYDMSNLKYLQKFPSQTSHGFRNLERKLSVNCRVPFTKPRRQDTMVFQVFFF